MDKAQLTYQGKQLSTAAGRLPLVYSIKQAYYSLLGNQENLALTRFELASGALRNGTVARYVAEVKNRGTAARDAGQVVHAEERILAEEEVRRAAEDGRVDSLLET